MPVETRTRARRSKLTHAQDHLALYGAAANRLPAEILNLIMDFSSPDTRAKMIRLNKRFHKSFGGALYRDIRIQAPLQLVQLFCSSNIAQRLGATLTLAVNRTVLWKHTWSGIRKRLTITEYLVRVLQMTTSLRGFVIYTDWTSDVPKYPNYSCEDSFIAELCERAANPAFLPLLARFSCCYSGRSILPLCRGRPIEVLCHSSTSDCVKNPAENCHPAGISPNHISLHFLLNTNPFDPESAINLTSRHMKDCANVGLAVGHLKLTVLAVWCPGQLDWEKFKANLVCWAGKMSSEGGCDHLNSLHISLIPSLANTPLELQRCTLDEIECFMPKLDRAVLGCPDVEWRKCTEAHLDPASRLPQWTPRPDFEGSGVLEWWSNKLGLDVVAVTKDGAQRAAIQMQHAMRTRWDDTSVPSIEMLQMYLSTAPPC